MVGICVRCDLFYYTRLLLLLLLKLHCTNILLFTAEIEDNTQFNLHEALSMTVGYAYHDGGQTPSW